jgi:hypothetical protein
MSTLGTYRTLAAGPVLSTTTAFRMGVGYLGVWTNRTPRLMTLGLQALEPGANAAKAEDTFWDELITAARDSTDVVLSELQRGIDDLGACTRAEQGPSVVDAGAEPPQI